MERGEKAKAKETEAALMSYKPGLPSRTYQQEALEQMAGRKGFALLMAMRTGKTHVALTDFGRMELAGEVKDMLVMAPAGLYRTWADPEDALAHLSQDLRDRLRIHIWTAKGGREHDRQLREFLAEKGQPRMLLINIEAISNTKGGRAQKVVTDFLDQKRGTVAIVDESTTIKGHGTERTYFACEEVAPRALYRRILSGLPTPQSPLDLYHQFEFLDRKILRQRNYYAFRARYAVMKKIQVGIRWVDIVDHFVNVEELYSLIKPHSVRVELSDVVNIPSTYSYWDVEMTPEQARVYKQLKENATAALKEEGHVTATMVLVRMLRLHQVLMGHVVDEEGVERVLAERRSSALLELLDTHHVSGKVVIWFSYDHDIRKVANLLRERYTHKTVACFWGGNVPEREGEDKRFREDPACLFMLATPGAGGRGRKWDAADMVVYYSSTDNLEHRDQSEERVKSVSDPRPKAYFDLRVRGTVDEKIIQALRKKINLASMITGDDFREWLV